MDTKRARFARNQQLNKRQKEIIIGSLLGDGYLVRTTNGFALRVNHSVKQKSYVLWKHKELEVFTNSQPRIYQNSCYFRTVTHPFFQELRNEFYRGGKKVLPENLEKLMTPLVISVWLMDDGSRDGNQLRFNTQSFSKEENRELCSVLQAKFGIMATLNRDKTYFRLRVKAASMPRIRQIVVPYIIPDMRYKLSP